MRLFAGWSLGLIILYAVLLKGTADKVTEGSNALDAGMKRFLSAGVAGVGNHAAKTAPVTGSGSTGGTPVGYRPPTTLLL